MPSPDSNPTRHRRSARVQRFTAVDALQPATTPLVVGGVRQVADVPRASGRRRAAAPLPGIT